MSLKRTKALTNLCYALACAAAMVAVMPAGRAVRWVGVGAALALFLLGVVLTACCYRCRSCKHILPKGKLPDSCPHCGQALQ